MEGLKCFLLCHHLVLQELQKYVGYHVVLRLRGVSVQHLN